ncbi:hypothetical protein ZWY2020_004224 [Hordeum vulgare]|nr:hypothetical protein ZWY2020_004224 [Hordeum vulgare]
MSRERSPLPPPHVDELPTPKVPPAEADADDAWEHDGGGGGVPTMGKQKVAMAGKPDPKNTRRALGDIRNVEANNRRPTPPPPPGDIANVANIRAAEG